jgi:hypothetical protein
MSMSEFISLAPDDSPGASTAASNLDVDSIEVETRRLLGLGDEDPYQGNGDGEGGQAVHPPGDAGTPPPTDPAPPADLPPAATTPDDLTPTLTVPEGMSTEPSTEDNFIIVEPGEVIEGVTDGTVPTATVETPAPATDYDYSGSSPPTSGSSPSRPRSRRSSRRGTI